MIRNPIIHKEVLSALRTRKAFFMQAIFFLVTACLIFLYWPDSGLQDVGGDQARRIFRTLAVGELLMVALFAPAFTASSITGEKERNTWESLYVTRMRPWEIALGKMAGSLTFVMLLVLCGSLAMAMPLLLGGVSGPEVAAAVGLLLLTAVYLGMIGLFISVISHRSYRSIIITYAILLVLLFFCALPAWPISQGVLGGVGMVWRKIFHVVASLSPLQAMLSLVRPGGSFTAAAPGMPNYWVLFIPLSLAVIVVTGLFCLHSLRRGVAPPRPREGLRIVERGQITARTFLFLIDPRKRKKPIRWWQNTVLAKEFRTRPMLQAQWLTRAVLFALIAAVCLMIAVALSVIAMAKDQSIGMVEAIASFVAAMMGMLVLLIGPAITGGSICADRETGVWDLMRTTRLSSASIVIGKFLSSIIPLALLAGATMPAMIILLYFDLNVWPNILRVSAVVGMTILFVSTCGTFFSAIFKRTATATAWTYAVLVAMGLLSLLVLLDPTLFSRRFTEGVFTVNPVVAAIAAAGYGPMQQYGLVGEHLRIMGIATAILLVLAAGRVYQLRRPD